MKKACLPLFLSLALLAGCATPGDSADTLTIWHAWGGAELQALKALIAQYHQTHPAVEIMALQVPYDHLKDKFLRSAAANGGPDMLIGDADWSGKFSAAQLVLPAATLFSPAELSRFESQTLKSLMLNGKLYAIPESRETVALYYNKRLLSKPPATIAGLLSEAAAVAESAKAQYGLVYNTTFYYTMGYFFGQGGRLFDGQDRLAVDSPAGLKTFEMFERLSRAPGVLTSADYNKGDSLYKEGQTAMMINGPWALRDYQKVLGKDLGVAMLPKLDNGHAAASWVGVKCMMFNSNADKDHRRLAHDFALFLTTPESQRLLSDTAGHIPAVKGISLPAESPLAVFQKQADVGTPVAIQPEVSLVWDPMDKALRQIIEHEATPRQALDGADTMIKAKLTEMRAQTQ